MNKKPTFIQRHSLLLFLLLTPLISLAIPFLLSPPAEVTPLMLVLLPALLAILLTGQAEGGKGVNALLKKRFQRINIKWVVIALGLALVLRLSLSLLAVIFGWIPNIRLNPWSPQQFVMIGVFTLFGAVMEELGWRGYALTGLLAHRSPLASALIIGLPWGVLHLGLILPGQMNAGTSWISTMLFIIALSAVLTWFFIQAHGSLLIVILHHAAQNFFVFLNGGIPIAQGSWLLAAVTAILAAMIILIYGPGLQRSTVRKTAAVDANWLEAK